MTLAHLVSVDVSPDLKDSRNKEEMPKERQFRRRKDAVHSDSAISLALSFHKRTPIEE